ncbi:hypothetical protein [Bacillus cereus group sp. MYBK220-1]|uniref:hypothetical protein n=1 Tax=Bacillus cereus group sp. MYBK220-1 TaxID=3450660 RepID=UPI003F79A2F3
MTITTVIAVAGLGLEIINTSTTIYKEFIKKIPLHFLNSTAINHYGDNILEMIKLTSKC